MGPTSLHVLTLLLAQEFLCVGQSANAQQNAGTTVSGLFAGRSGKPMAKMRLIVAEVAGDQELTYAKIKLAADAPMGITDDKGQFQFTGVSPGMHVVLYTPASSSKMLPAEINIKALSAVTKSPLPLLQNVQIGDTGPPNPDRVWGRTFTLLKGHTFYAEGANMKIWNATVRFGSEGPYLEVRRGMIVEQRFPDKSPIKLIAWSY